MKKLQEIALRNMNLSFLNGREKSILRNIGNCLTSRMGSNELRCECGHHETHYNSCRDRHCPLCQGAARARWVQNRMKELLPVPYFHVVFTVPHELLPIVLVNRKIFYTTLFEAVHATLLSVCANTNNLGAKVGGLSVLHTWNQKLAIHPHVHVIIPSGGISLDGKSWIKGSALYLVSVKKLSLVFRGKLLSALESLLKQNKLYGDIKVIKDSLIKTSKKSFVVYAKQPFGGPEQVLKYLGRYTHRVGISEQRIVSVKNNTVAFSYTDRANAYAKKIMTLNDSDFIRKFMLHVLPKGLRKIRYFGYMGNRNRTESLGKVRALITEAGVALLDVVPNSPEAMSEKNQSYADPICSKCGKIMTLLKNGIQFKKLFLIDRLRLLQLLCNYSPQVLRET